jgi:hypothetical protein
MRIDTECIHRTDRHAHTAAVAQIHIDFCSAHVGCADGPVFATSDTGLADDVIPGNTGVTVHRSFAYIRGYCVCKFNFYGAYFDAGLAERTSSCAEVKIGQAIQLVVCGVQADDVWFAGCRTGVCAANTVFV